MTDVDVQALWIGHWPKPLSGATEPDLRAFRPQALVLDTCLRQAVVTTDPVVAARAACEHPADTAAGTAAFEFLLEVTTGLRSAVPGETNVFGQFKRAWQVFRHSGDAAAVTSLAPIVARLICDTREIRQQHLQNIGGASYGALVRRLIRPANCERILIVGAGELARALLPFFRGFDLGLWNRRAVGPLFGAAGRVFSPDAGRTAAAWAEHVIMTTPADDANDGVWRDWLAAASPSSVVHLGRRRAAPWRLPAPLRAFDLDDVFDLRRAQANIRSLQLERARLACRERGRRLTPTPPAAAAVHRACG